MNTYTKVDDGDGVLHWKFFTTGETFAPVETVGEGVVVCSVEESPNSSAEWTGLLCLDAADGTERFRTSDLEPPVGIADGTVYATAAGGTGDADELVALSPDGDRRWRYGVDGSVEGLATADGTVYVSDSTNGRGGAVHAVDPDGERRWRYDYEGDVKTSATAVLAATPDAVYGAGGGERGETRVRRLSDPDGDDSPLDWEVTLDEREFVDSLATGSDAVVFVQSDRVSVFEAATGDRRWTSSIDDIFGGAAVTDDAVYVSTYAASIRSYDLRTGDRRWETERTEAANDNVGFLVAGDTALYGSFGDMVVEIDYDYEYEPRQLAALDSSAIGLAFEDGVLYFGAFTHMVYAARPDGSSGGGTGTSTDSGGDSRCFVATAAYGTPTADEIDVLRSFRDEVLARSALTRWTIPTYYRLSPPVARWIARDERRRRLARRYVVGPAVRAVDALMSLEE